MSKTPTSDLYQLIQALTKTEKRYVKQHLTKHTGIINNQSILLFNALCGQATYDEEEIRTRHDGSGFVKRMSKAKQELLQQILNAMRAYHANRTREREVIVGLLDVEFLLDRGQKALALKKADAVHRLAEDIHDHALAYKVLMLERAIVGETPDSARTDIELLNSMRLNVEKLGETTYYETLSSEISNLIHAHGSDVRLAKKVADDLMTQARKRAKPKHRNARMAWLRTLSRKALHIDSDPEKALKYDQQRLEIFQADPMLMRERFVAFINLLHGVTLRLIVTGRFEAAKPYRDIVRAQWEMGSKSQSAEQRRHVAGTFATLELLNAVQNLHHPVSPKFLKEMVDVVDFFEDGKKTEVGMANHFNIALLYYSIENRKQCLFSLLDVIEYPDHLRSDIHLGADLLRILVHHELDHPRLVESLIRTLRREYGKGLSDYPDAGILVRTVTQLQSAATPALRRTVIQKAMSGLAAVYSTQGSYPPTKLFDFMAWCSAQLKRTTWAQEVGKALQD